MASPDLQKGDESATSDRFLHESDYPFTDKTIQPSEAGEIVRCQGYRENAAHKLMTEWGKSSKSIFSSPSGSTASVPEVTNYRPIPLPNDTTESTESDSVFPEPGGESILREAYDNQSAFNNRNQFNGLVEGLTGFDGQRLGNLGTVLAQILDKKSSPTEVDEREIDEVDAHNTAALAVHAYQEGITSEADGRSIIDSVRSAVTAAQIYNAWKVTHSHADQYIGRFES